MPNAWACCARASCVGAVPLCATARPDLRRRCCPSSVWLVGNEPGVGMSIFARLICRVLSGRMPGARVSCIAPAPPCVAVCHGGLCWLFASATLVRRGSDVRSLFCFPANVRNAVLIAAKCPGLSLRSCAAVCDRSPYPLPASSPWRFPSWLPFFFFFLCRRKTKVSDRGFESRRRHMWLCAFFFFLFASKKN